MARLIKVALESIPQSTKEPYPDGLEVVSRFSVTRHDQAYLDSLGRGAIQRWLLARFAEQQAAAERFEARLGRRKRLPRRPIPKAMVK